MWGFWIASSGMAFMTFTLTFAGTVQTHVQRVMGEPYMDTQEYLSLFYWMRLGSGVVVVFGVLLIVYALLVPGRQRVSIKTAAQPAE